MNDEPRVRLNRADRTYHIPAGLPQVPLPYSVKATRPR
jgi:hypothetical protein